MAAVEAALAKAGRRRRARSSEFSHGMTVATNALLEGRGARTAFVATEGFTDLVELGRQDRPELYRLCAARPAPLAPDELRFGAPERMTPDGPLRELDDRARPAREPGRRGRARGGRGRAAALLPPSRARAGHRRRAARRRCPDAHVSLSHEVVGTFREYERAATTEIDAALSPLLGRLPAPARRARARSRPARAGDHAVERRPDRCRGGRRPRRVDGAVRAGRRRRGSRVRRPRRRRPTTRCASTWAEPRATCASSTTAPSRSRAAARSPGARWRCRCSPSTRSAPAAARSPGATRAARCASARARRAPTPARRATAAAAPSRPSPTRTSCSATCRPTRRSAGGVELDRDGGRAAVARAGRASSDLEPLARAPRGSSASPTPR